MRQLADRALIGQFMAELGRGADKHSRIYLTGGATAVLIGWRLSTIDIDVRIEPDDGTVLRLIPALKESLGVNVELASPADFLPVVDGWQDRSPFVASHGPLSFHHFELVAQALAKIERAHSQDEDDVQEMLTRGLVTPAQLLDYLDRIEPDLFRFPAVDLSTLREAVERVTTNS